MGMRSQIYVKYNDRLIIANYYGWNYGERMISRARYGMEYLKYYVDNDCTWDFINGNVEKYRRYFDVNFDYQDIVMSQNILEEYKKSHDSITIMDTYDEVLSFIYYEQDNNDGKLLIDVKGKTIKYAFVDYDINTDNIMTPEQYIKWDVNGAVEDAETLAKNIEVINSIAELMTCEEVEKFVSSI